MSLSSCCRGQYYNAEWGRVMKLEMETNRKRCKLAFLTSYSWSRSFLSLSPSLSLFLAPPTLYSFPLFSPTSIYLYTQPPVQPTLLCLARHQRHGSGRQHCLRYCRPLLHVRRRSRTQQLFPSQHWNPDSECRPAHHNEWTDRNR